MVGVPDLKSEGRGFKSHSDYLAGNFVPRAFSLELFLGGSWSNSSVLLVNVQLVFLPPVGIFNHVMLICIICFIIYINPEKP